VGVTVAVVGAGLTGLSAAWELSRAGADVVVLEAGRRPGGVIVTERHDGFVVEGGPDGFPAAERDLPALARALGIGDRLVDQQAAGSTLWTGQRLDRLAEGRAADLLGIQGTADVDLARGFQSFARGMQDIVDALVGRLGAAIRSTHGVTGIVPTTRGWRLSVTGGSAQAAEGVILAHPAWAIARLLAGLGIAPARALGEVVSYPSRTVSLAYRTGQLPRTLDGTGFVVAREAPGAVRACSYASFKYPGRAPDGHALLRAFLGPVDGEAGVLAHAELATILGIRDAPLWSRGFHWPRGLPRYQPGHATHVAALRARLARLAPLDVAGAGIDGAGVSACVKSGRAAAIRVLGRLA
jgi:oxygen-dependent protoporphyrinogen oxidase